MTTMPPPRTITTPSVILPDGTLNVSLLENEINRELSDDNQYRAQDEMKKRAIHMSKDYDEFRAFVACSQLQPVQRSDMKELIQPNGTTTTNKNDQQQRKQQIHNNTKSKERRNTRRRNRSSSSSSPQIQIESFPSRPPQTLGEFTRDWYRHCNNTDCRVRYLTEEYRQEDTDKRRRLVEPVDAGRFFRVDFECTIFGQIIETLHSIVMLENFPLDGILGIGKRAFVLEWLSAFVGPKLEFAVSFLSKKENGDLSCLMNYLEEDECILEKKLGGLDVVDLKRAYGLGL